MTDELTERVALAIAEADYAFGCYDEMARAAMEAMREPTQAMLDRAAAHLGQQSYSDVWTDMINAALDGEP